MSWDSKLLVVLTLTWAALAVIYVTVIGMMPGARGWGVGAALFLALLFGVVYAERRGVRRHR